MSPPSDKDMCLILTNPIGTEQFARTLTPILPGASDLSQSARSCGLYSTVVQKKILTGNKTIHVSRCRIVDHRLQLSLDPVWAGLVGRGFIQDVSRRSTERRKPLQAGGVKHIIKEMPANSRAVLSKGAGPLWRPGGNVCPWRVGESHHRGFLS